MIHPEHNQAQSLSSEAALLKAAGHTKRAAELYRVAAEHERIALAAVPPDQLRWMGVLAVSLAALEFKGGNLEAAAETCLRYLGRTDLPDFARAQLEEILRAASTPSTVS